jgi:ribonuclease HII
MRQAIQDLPKTADLILVDGAMAPPIATPCWPLVHGDRRSYVVGCASIMAKVLRDRLMEFYHALVPHYGFNRHKGYGTVLHAERLRRFGPSVFHRRSFKPVAEVMMTSMPEGHFHFSNRAHRWEDQQASYAG